MSKKFLILALIAAATLIVGVQVSHAQCVVDDAAFTSTDGGCRDNATGAVFSLQAPGSWTWNGGNSHCSGLVEGSFSDWTLPTKNELVLAAAHGASSHLNVTQGAGNYWWSDTATGKQKWGVDFANGNSLKFSTGSALLLVCVR